MEKIWLKRLRSFPLFSSLTDDELLRISGSITIREFAKAEAVLREEDTNSFMYIILSGKVKVTQVTDDGREIILALHGPADFFGVKRYRAPFAA